MDDARLDMLREIKTLTDILRYELRLKEKHEAFIQAICEAISRRAQDIKNL